MTEKHVRKRTKEGLSSDCDTYDSEEGSETSPKAGRSGCFFPYLASENFPFERP